jgi:hypothetical protein
MTASRTTTGGVLALLFAGALALAACGSSGPSVSAASDTAAPVTQPAGSEPAGSAPSDSSGSATVDTDFSGEGSEEVCSYARDIQQSDILNGSDLNKEQFEKFEEVIQNFEEKAPAEIKGDVQTFQKTIVALKAIYEKYDYDATKLAGAATSDPEVSKVVASMSEPEFEQASTRLDAYFQQVCGIAGSS